MPRQLIAPCGIRPRLSWLYSDGYNAGAAASCCSLSDQDTGPQGRYGRSNTWNVPQVVIVTLGRPVFDNSTNDLQYEVTFVPNMRHQSKTVDFYKRHANATGSPKVYHSPELMSVHPQNYA